MSLINIGQAYELLHGYSTRYGNRMRYDRESSAELWRKKGAFSLVLAISAVTCLALSACETGLVQSLPTFSSRSEPGGIVATDEPQAALIARDILNAGGSAADAAVALGFSLGVTLQSAAGLGGGGICTVFDSETGRVEALDFTPPPAVGKQLSARWQVAVPSLARGLFALHAKYGKLPWQQVVVPSENVARFGNIISRSFAFDLRTASESLVNDPEALDTFMSPRRTMLDEGDRLSQLELAAVLGRIRGKLPGDFYAGALARTIDDSAQSSGVSLDAEDLRRFSPQWKSTHVVQIGDSNLYFATSGVDQQSVSDALSRDNTVETPLTTSTPSSTGFVVADASGMAVACSLTMIQPFGIGLMLDGLGFLLAPSPDSQAVIAPQLVPVIAIDRNSQQVTFAGATGGEGASEVLSTIARVTLLGEQSVKDSYPTHSRSDIRRAQVNAFFCPQGLMTSFEACFVNSDPAGLGYGLIAYGNN